MTYNHEESDIFLASAVLGLDPCEEKEKEKKKTHRIHHLTIFDQDDRKQGNKLLLCLPLLLKKYTITNTLLYLLLLTNERTKRIKMADIERSNAGDDRPADVWHVMDIDNTLEQMKTSKKGLSTSKASELFKQYGPNEMTEKRKKTLLERM